MTLKDVLERRDVPDLLGPVQKNIKTVETYRNSWTTNYHGSELSPTLTREEIEATGRAG
jgi:hypothetical protein